MICHIGNGGSLMDTILNTDTSTILSEAYVSRVTPENIGSITIADRPCNPQNSYVLNSLLEDLYNSIDLSKGAHTILKEHDFKLGMKNLIMLAIAQQSNPQPDDEYNQYLAFDAKIRIPAQIQWILERCTTHNGDTTIVKPVLSASALEVYESWDKAKVTGQISQVFKSLYVLQAKDRIPFRLAETLPTRKQILADTTLDCWIVESETHESQSNVMVPYPKYNPAMTALAALLQAESVEKLDSTVYCLRSDTVGELAKGLV